MNTTPETIGQRMAAKQAASVAEITTALWADNPDGNAVADMALAGGVTADAVDKMVATVTAGKVALAAAIEADRGAADLANAASKARQSAARTAAVLEKAQAEHDAASDSLQDVERQQADNATAINDAARLVEAGSIPPTLAPPFLQQLVERRRVAAVEADRAAKIATLRRTIAWRRSRIRALEAELEAERRRDPDRDNVIVGGRGLVGYADAISGRIRVETAAMEEAEAELAELAK
jgi:hypothetical protein